MQPRNRKNDKGSEYGKEKQNELELRDAFMNRMLAGVMRYVQTHNSLMTESLLYEISIASMNAAASGERRLHMRDARLQAGAALKRARSLHLAPPILVCCACWCWLHALCFAGSSDSPRTGINSLALTNTIRLSIATNQVPTLGKAELDIQLPKSASRWTNPFDPEQIDVSIIVRQPNGAEIRIPAFFAEDFEYRTIPDSGRNRDWVYPKRESGWHARFAPLTNGTHSVRAVYHDASGTQSTSAPVSIEALPSTLHGFLRASRTDPRFFEYSTGEPFFAIGQNLAFIGPEQYTTLAKAESIFEQLAANGANYLRVWTCCEDWAMAVEARKSAWGRSWYWKPSFAPHPDDPDPLHPRRQCVLLKTGAVLDVNPSQPVALKPETKYTARLKTRRMPGTPGGGGGPGAEGDLSVRLELHGVGELPTFAVPTGTNWTVHRHTFTTRQKQYWLGPVRLAVEGQGDVALDDVSLFEGEIKEDSPAGSTPPNLLWEADPNRPVLGTYNQLDCYLLDRIVAAADQYRLVLQLCLLTRDLYMDALKQPDSEACKAALSAAKKTLRYAVARWGYSTSIGAWEYWNELDPNLPTDAFYLSLGEYLEDIDPYRHLRTTSTWGPSPKDPKHPKLDVANAHYYLRPSDKTAFEDEVQAIQNKSRALRDQAPDKPVLIAEFGLATDKWQATDEMKSSPSLLDAHNALWSSALSGTSGTAMLWWWERLDERGVYPLYKPLSRFVAGIPWTSGKVRTLEVDTPSGDDRVRVLGLVVERQAWVWIFNKQASWQQNIERKQLVRPISNAKPRLPSLKEGTWHITWFDTTTGLETQDRRAQAGEQGLELEAPPFTTDIACKLLRER